MSEWDPDDVFDLLGDDYVRAILAATSREPMSAKALSEACDASLPTVYRRVDSLVERGFLTERTQLDPDGNHFHVYETRVDRVTVDVTGEGLAVDVGLSEPASDRFTHMWESIRRS